MKTFRPRRVTHPIGGSSSELGDSTETEDDPSLCRIVGRHFHFNSISDHQANKSLPHFPGNVRQDLVATCKFNFKHRTGKHRRDCSFNLNGLLFRGLIVRFIDTRAALLIAAASASASSEISWSSDSA